jgi:hypothetical protein
MTPIHGVPLKDTGEREAAKRPEPKEVAPMTPPGFDLNDTDERAAARTEQEAHMFECWNRPGGPGYELSQKVDRVRLWVAGASVLGLVASVLGPVVLGWWLSTRLPAPARANSESPSLIKTAHAETKGTP